MYLLRPNPGGPLFVHRASGSGLERDGLWLIAVGALLIVIALLVGGHQGGLGGRPVGRQGTRRDRMVYAVTAAGACLVAVGSIIVAVKAFPAWWVVVVTVAGGGLAVWLFAAWRLRVDSGSSRDDVRSGLETYDEDIGPIPGYVEEHEWDLKRYGRQTHWGWCLANAFTSEANALSDAEAHFGRRPSQPQPPQRDPSQPEP
jgi:hypothetical protein